MINSWPFYGANPRHFVLFLVFVGVNCTTLTNSTLTDAPINYLPVYNTAVNLLDWSSAPETTGQVSVLKVLGNMATRFRSDGKLTWNVEVESGVSTDYGVEVVASFFGAPNFCKVRVTVDPATSSSSVKGTIRRKDTHWPTTFDTVKNYFKQTEKQIAEDYLWSYSRHAIAETITLKPGKQTISLEAYGLQTKQLIDFRSLNLIPVAAKGAIAKDKADAKAARANTNWFMNSKYGIMVHWTDLTVNLDGSRSTYQKAVNSFNVPKFAALCADVGAKHVIFTVNHQHPHCPAPIAEWATIHPGWTTERDLLGEIADALTSKSIKFMIYVASHLVGQSNGLGDAAEVKWLAAHRVFSNSDLKKNKHFDITKNNKIVLEAMGKRYKEKLSGIWLDGWDLIPETYPQADFKGIFMAAKAGNSDRLVAFNRWIFPTVSHWQDYWAGEMDSPEDIVEKTRYIGFDAGLGLQYHSLISMEQDWVLTKENLQEYGKKYYTKPRLKGGEIISYVKRAMKRQGVVTINVAIEQNGAIMPATRSILKKLKAEIRKGNSPVPAPSVSKPVMEPTKAPKKKYQSLKNVGYCNSGEVAFKGLNPAKCWKKCRSIKRKFVEWMPEACYCQKKCPCMDDVNNKERITMAPLGYKLPKVCGACKDRDLKYKNNAQKNCAWVKANSQFCKKKWEGEKIMTYWCPVSCGGC
mmetsp:Transcript_1009/g.2152  ORF Transcript_1009/g.2152 Transcript_1009/m.2152 type:complete len:692 (+) Transcript_1009:173-2248(+)